MGKIKTTGSYRGKSNRLGGGGRFAQVEAEAAARGASNPAAVAAAAGRKKYGAAKMVKMAVAGKKRSLRHAHHNTGNHSYPHVHGATSRA